MVYLFGGGVLATAKKVNHELQVLRRVLLATQTLLFYQLYRPCLLQPLCSLAHQLFCGGYARLLQKIAPCQS